MVHAKAAQIEVLHPKEESVQAFLPEDDGNGLSQELFVYDAVIRVSPFEGLHSADGLMQEVFSALWQGTLARCNAFANYVSVALTRGHSD
ncbi:TPA: hypothetical protein ACH3X1_001376 [Trebouxia sp. C0004]